MTESIERQVWDALSRITDPEMPVSLVDMGMVYGVEVHDGLARIDLTFTSSEPSAPFPRDTWLPDAP